MKNDNPQILINSQNPNKISIPITDSQINESNESESKKGDLKYNSGRWTEEEHKRFLEGILIYGNEWKKVQNVIKTRSSTQARSHAQKFFLRIKKDLKFHPSVNNYNFNLISDDNQIGDNFSIKYFFDILNENEENKFNLKYRKLNNEQKEKIWNFVSKFPSNITKTNEEKNNKLTNNNIKNDIEIVINEKNTKKKNKQLLFNIVKDYTIRESINSKKKINDIKINDHIKKSESNSTNSESDLIFNGKKRENDFPEIEEIPKINSFNINLFDTNYGIELNNCNNCNNSKKSLFGDINENNLANENNLVLEHNYPFYSTDIEYKNYIY